MTRVRIQASVRVGVRFKISFMVGVLDTVRVKLRACVRFRVISAVVIKGSGSGFGLHNHSKLKPEQLCVCPKDNHLMSSYYYYIYCTQYTNKGEDL